MDPIDRLLIERECARLVTAYTHHVDFGEASKVADLFTDDGTWSSPEVTMEGREQIRAGFARRESMARVSKHVCTNLLVNVVDDNHAEGVVYLTLYRADTDAPIAALDGPALVGHYRDTFVRTDVGWRIASRRTEVTFMTPAVADGQ